MHESQFDRCAGGIGQEHLYLSPFLDLIDGVFHCECISRAWVFSKSIIDPVAEQGEVAEAGVRGVGDRRAARIDGEMDHAPSSAHSQ
jgi:hypothetical protein